MRDDQEEQPTPNRDPDTIARLLAGDPDGIRQLFEDHGGIVRARLRRTFGRLFDNSEIDEVLSLTSIRVWHAASDFDPQLGTLRAWVSVIARRCALRFLEARQRLHAVEQPGDIDPVDLGPAIAATTQQGQALLAAALDCLRRLPTLQRAVLLADFKAGEKMPADVLAKRLRTSTNSIYVSRHKGRLALRQALRAHRRATDQDKDGTVDGGAQQ